MSDYIAGLRQDLVEAAARQQAAAGPARVRRSLLLPRMWSPPAVLGAAVAAAALVAVVLGLRAVSPPRPPEAPKVIERFHIGGQPRDATSAGGYVFVSDFNGRLLRFTPAGGGRRALGTLAATPVSLAADGDDVWTTGFQLATGSPRSNVMKIDGRTGQVLAAVDLRRDSTDIALGAGGIWAVTDLGPHEGGLVRLDPRTLRTTVAVPGTDSQGMAASAHAVWTRRDGTVTERDERGHVVSRVGGVSPILGMEGQRTIAADNDGAWVVGQSDGLLYRIEKGQVVSRVQVGDLAGVIARTPSAVWVTALVGPERWALVRVDPDDGKVTGRVDLGSEEPQTIVPVGTELWVTTQRGTVTLVSQE